MNILFDQQARDKMKIGVNTLAEAVGSTLGPKGRNVAIKEHFRPLVVHDGVTVARRAVDYIKDPHERMGAELIRDAAVATNDVAGDGTTTATILAQAIVNEAFKQIEAGSNPQTLKKGIEEALKVVLVELSKLAKKVTTDEEIEQVATISSADPILGKLIAEAVKKVGLDGVVTVDEGSGFETTVDFKQGMEIDNGYLSPYFVTETETVEAKLDNPYILLTDLKLSHNYEIIPFIEKFLIDGRKDLVIFASTVNDEALQTLVVNNIRVEKPINVIAIQAPAYGGRRLDELQDMAVLTGGQVISADSGRSLDSVTIEELGRADKVVSDRDKTVIYAETLGGKKGAVQARIDELKAQLKVSNTDFDRDIKKQRIAKLSGGVAVVNVGAATAVEMKEKKERVIDAVNATKAAIEEGIVAGGEITLLQLADTFSDGLFQIQQGVFIRDDVGHRILNQALKQPFKKLVENAGMDYAEVRARMANKKYPFGINVQNEDIMDLIKAGIIDPVKVTRSALENAVSVACMLLTTNTLIAEELEEK